MGGKFFANIVIIFVIANLLGRFIEKIKISGSFFAPASALKEDAGFLLEEIRRRVSDKIIIPSLNPGMEAYSAFFQDADTSSLTQLLDWYENCPGPVTRYTIVTSSADPVYAVMLNV